MKLGLLTFTEGENIGQRLQNYALQEVLSSRGHEVYTIRQQKPAIKIAAARLKYPHSGVSSDAERKSIRCFEEFNEKLVHFFQEPLTACQNYVEIKGFKFPYRGNGKKFDAIFDGFVVGSDQIWNPNSPDVGESYFLTFTSDKKRFNYAPSFSVDEIPTNKREMYKKWLEGFPYLTVREDQGAKIIRDLTGREAQVVLDPTLLLDKGKYDLIRSNCDSKPQDDYIVSLFLGSEPKEEVEAIASELGLGIFRITKPIVVPPDEFLDVVDNAKLILTDSYHVTIFSMIYHKPFINFARAGGESMNSRFITLYRMTGAKNRVWGSRGDVSDWLNMPYEKIDKTINENRKISFETLERQGL